MALTLGASVNRALRTIGEPDITAFTATNQLQNTLIDDANETVHDILEATRHRWGVHRDYFTTTAKINDGAVTLTNGNTTVTSVSATGEAVSADNFTNVSAGMFFRRATELDSYRIASVSTSSSPDTLVLEDAYQGTTSATGVGYNILQDTYAISITDLDEIQRVRYGDSVRHKDLVDIVDIQTILDRSQGDLHRDASGLPRYMAKMSPDASDVPRWVLWPYPDSAYLMEVWYSLKFTSNTTFATNMFGGDAPDIFYDAVAHHMRWRACIWDEDVGQADRWLQAYSTARAECIARDNRTNTEDNQMSIKTYRRRAGVNSRGRRGQSQMAFDRE